MVNDESFRFDYHRYQPGYLQHECVIWRTWVCLLLIGLFILVAVTIRICKNIYLACEKGRVHANTQWQMKRGHTV